jgi:hypothetical protein
VIRLVESFDHNGGSSAASVADGRAADGGVVGLQDAVQGTDDAGPGRANGVAQGHGAPVHVHLGQVQVQQSARHTKQHRPGTPRSSTKVTVTATVTENQHNTDEKNKQKTILKDTWKLQVKHTLRKEHF